MADGGSGQRPPPPFPLLTTAAALCDDGVAAFVLVPEPEPGCAGTVSVDGGRLAPRAVAREVTRACTFRAATSCSLSESWSRRCCISALRGQGRGGSKDSADAVHRP